MVVGDAHVFPSSLTIGLVNTTFLSKAYFSHMLLQRWEAKIHRKEIRLNQGSNSQPPGRKSDTLTTERGRKYSEP